MDHSLSRSYALCYQALSANVFFVCIIQGPRKLDAVAVTTARILKFILFSLAHRFVYEFQLFTEISLHRIDAQLEQIEHIDGHTKSHTSHFMIVQWKKKQKTPWF
jgi:hypothetical protein